MTQARRTTISRAEYLQLVGLLALGQKFEGRVRDIHEAMRELLGIADGTNDSDQVAESIYERYTPDELLARLGIPLVFNDGAEELPAMRGFASHGGRDESAAFLNARVPVERPEAARLADVPNAGGADSP